MTFLEEAAYESLVAFVVAAKPQHVAPSAWTGSVGRDEAMIALGEQCDVWPTSACDDC